MVPKCVRQGFQDAFGSRPFADIRCVSDNFQQVSPRVDQNVSFASIHCLASVEAMLTPHFSCSHALTVNNCQAGLGFSSRAMACLFAQGHVHLLPGRLPTPLMKMLIHAL